MTAHASAFLSLLAPSTGVSQSSDTNTHSAPNVPNALNAPKEGNMVVALDVNDEVTETPRVDFQSLLEVLGALNDTEQWDLESLEKIQNLAETQQQLLPQNGNNLPVTVDLDEVQYLTKLSTDLANQIDFLTQQQTQSTQIASLDLSTKVNESPLHQIDDENVDMDLDLDLDEQMGVSDFMDLSQALKIDQASRKDTIDSLLIKTDTDPSFSDDMLKAEGLVLVTDAPHGDFDPVPNLLKQEFQTVTRVATSLQTSDETTLEPEGIALGLNPLNRFDNLSKTHEGLQIAMADPKLSRGDRSDSLLNVPFAGSVSGVIAKDISLSLVSLEGVEADQNESKTPSLLMLDSFANPNKKVLDSAMVEWNKAEDQAMSSLNQGIESSDSLIKSTLLQEVIPLESDSASLVSNSSNTGTHSSIKSSVIPTLATEALSKMVKLTDSTAISEKIMVMASADIRQAVIQLDPAELGHIEIRLSLQQDQAQVQIVSQNSQVRDALEQQSAKLKEALAEQGVNLSDLDVSSQQQSSQQQSKSHAEAEFTSVDQSEEERAPQLQSVSIASLSQVDHFV